MEIIDAQDVLVDRYVNPWDLDSARRITHTGIYVTLSDIERNAMFDKAMVNKLKAFFATEMGLVAAAQNAEMATDKLRGLNRLESPTS